MAKIFGHSETQIVPQSDFNAAQNENGGWTATQSFRVRKGAVDNASVKNKFPGGATLQSLDPNCDDYFAYLRLSHITSCATVEGGWTLIGVHFVGFVSQASTNDPAPEITLNATYSKRGTLVEAPLHDHPKWKDLSVKERNSLGKLLNGEWTFIEDPFNAGSYVLAVQTGSSDSGEDQYSIRPTADQLTSDDAKTFAAKIAEGRTTYKHGTYSYVHRWESNEGITAAQMNDLGKISTPSGSPPTPGTGRDWLMTGADEEQYGSGDFRFTNELTYLLSDEGGHDSFLQS